jgi:hypothetical protein
MSVFSNNKIRVFMNSNSIFFETKQCFIDQKNIRSKFSNCYQIFNDKKENIGLVKQRFTKKGKIVRAIFSKSVLPFQLEIRSSNGTLEATLSRGWFLLKAIIVIKDTKGKKMGSIKQNFCFLKPRFKILNASDKIIAEISGDCKEWDFRIIDSSQNQIGSLDRKQGRFVQKMFISSDRSNLTIESNNSNKEDKITILSSAITFCLL